MVTAAHRAGASLAVTLDDVGWSYAAADAPSARDVCLQVRPGEVVVLCGGSGSGKSTVLRAMNGLVPHFYDGTLSGTVTVGGRAVSDAALHETGQVTGTVLQHPRRQFFTGAIESELAFAAENFGHDPARIRSAVEESISAHGLHALRDVPLGKLSGGQQQQVALASACLHEPAVVLVDEPTANLSTASVGRFVRLVRRLRDHGTAVVVAEHRLRYLRGVADRYVVLESGRVRQDWPAAALQAADDTELGELGLRSWEAGEIELPRGCAYGPSVTHDSSSSGGAGPGDVVLHGERCDAGGRRILDIERALLPTGTVTAIRGPNGAGKSTLARVVTGLQRHAGEVRVDGRPQSRRRRLQRSAIVMQDVQRQLFGETVEAELAIGSGAKPDADRTEDLLEQLDLTRLRGRHPLSLSGGEQQRLVIAGAMLSGRSVVVFDEPSSGVDRRHLESVASLIRRCAARGSVVLLITHDDELLRAAADQQIEIGPPRGDAESG